MKRADATVTIHDVAAKAGVSVATVSRVLTGSARVAEERAARVRAAVESTGYVPNAAGRILRRQTADVIGVVVPEFNPFFSQVVDALEEAVAPRGFTVVLHNCAGRADREQRFIEIASLHRMAGLAIAVSSETGLETTRTTAATMPIVLFDREMAGYRGDCVAVDNEEAGWRMGEHFLDRGFTRPACLAGPTQVPTTVGRTRGFVSALAAGGVTVEPDHIVHTALAGEEARRATLDLLGRTPIPTREMGVSVRDGRVCEPISHQSAHLDTGPDAIFATTGPLTVGAFQAMAESGITIPLAGFDDDPWTRIVRPQVTVVRQPVEGIGQSVAELLLARLDGDDRPAIRRVLNPELVVRDSTAG